MTIHRRNYRPFDGERRPPAGLFWAITRRELRLGIRKKWVKRLLVVSTFPMVAFMFMLYVQLVVEKTFNTRILGVSVITELYAVEVFFVVLMMAALGADIIAKDVAAKSHVLYFSRPLTPTQYVIGKVVAVAAIIGLILIVPGLLLSLAQLLLAPEQDWAQFGRLCGGILVSGVLLSLAASLLIACLSSYGKRARFVGAIWVGLYFFSSGASGGMLQVTDGAEWAKLLSIHTLFIDAGRFFYDDVTVGATALLVLMALAAVAGAVLLRRVRVLERSEQ